MGTTQLFWGCEMSSEKDQFIAPSQEVLQDLKMCLDAAAFYLTMTLLCRGALNSS